ncbi:ATP-binding protein [Fictibacillus terranigra]|uniref:histidine kinase n=1 Tax=Fictibacillus terranigra TaxID=3058424 RepID=A0ABT8E2Y8_9BACL|nr:ATP-binding protein [Fictibacillus sp. CENA-BCM004]MDN4072277.1 ATP-binding protein [Fictibacillus sp. CENA-BCM004]
MKKVGQVTLVCLSIAFTAYQKVLSDEPFFTFDFMIFTVIAWLVGWQYDTARENSKNARANEESYKTLIDALPEAVIIHRNTAIIYINQAAAQMWGAGRKEDVIGKSLYDFVAPEHVERLLKDTENLPLNTFEVKVESQGVISFLELSSLMIVFGKNKAILSVIKDVTARQEETNRLLRKSEKLALLGQMAAGIAHEIRNPLTSVKGFIQLIKVNRREEEYVSIVLDEIDRINGIVGDLLVLAKPRDLVFIEQNMMLVLKEVITMIQTQADANNIMILEEYEPDLPLSYRDKNQIKQVFLNLLMNAIEAMPDGGVIMVKLKKEGEMVSIKIIDEGIGIPEERIPTLGEPFYTTKDKGTGLGLMICCKIIENHNGLLTIQSKVLEGTTVEIKIPCSDKHYKKQLSTLL